MSKNTPMSETKKLKWSRMRFIIDKLKQQPMSSQELLESLQKASLIKEGTIGKRSIQNYLEELCAIEVLRLDRLSGVYRFAEYERRVFESKHDYQIALAHSKSLLFSNSKENTLRFDHTNPYLAVDLLVYESERDADNFAILQHLKTGYPEIYQALQKYRQLMDETGLSKGGCLPKLGGGMDFDEDDEHFLKYYNNPVEQLSDKPIEPTLSDKVDGKVIAFGSGGLGNEGVIARVPASIVKEISDLRDLIVGKIYGYIMNMVRNGAPLKGSCDFCPNKEVEINEK